MVIRHDCYPAPGMMEMCMGGHFTCPSSKRCCERKHSPPTHTVIMWCGVAQGHVLLKLTRGGVSRQLRPPSLGHEQTRSCFQD